MPALDTTDPRLQQLEPEDPTLAPHQREIRRTLGEAMRNDKIALVYGGRGTFKTSTIVHALFNWLWFTAHYWRGIRIAVVAQNYRQLREVFLETWIEQADPRFWYFSDGNKRIEIKGVDLSGRRIDAALILRHAGDEHGGRSSQRAATGRRGANISGFLGIEAHTLSDLFSKELAKQCRKRPEPSILGDVWRPPYRFRCWDTNPAGPDHWLYRQALASDSAVKQHFVTYGIPTTAATSAYTAPYIDFLRQQMLPQEAARELDAEWVGNIGQMFPIGRQHINDKPPPQGGRWFLAHDYGYFPDPFISLLCYVAGPWIWIAGEVRMLRASPEDQLARVETMVRQVGESLDTRIELAGIVGDSSGSYATDELPEYNSNVWWADTLEISLQGTNKSRKPGWKRIIRMILIEIEGRPRLTLHSRCEKTERAMRAMRWSETPRLAGDSDPGCDDHAPDALRYLVMSEILQ